MINWQHDTNTLEDENDMSVQIDGLIEQILKVLSQSQPQVRRVHLEPFEGEWRVRGQVDSEWVTLWNMSPEVGKMLVETLMNKTGIMKTGDPRLPMDDFCQVSFEGKPVLLCISSLPVIWGTRLMISLARTALARLSLENLGLDLISLRNIRNVAAEKHGLIVIAGGTE